MSTRYNTGNPIESTDVRDMSDNAKNFDDFANSKSNEFTDRFGVERKTIHGMNSQFDSHILNTGFTRVGTFATGATLTNPRQTLLWDIADGGDGQEYGWSGAFPKVVLPLSTPNTTGGIAVGKWMSRFDPELRIMVRESIRRSYAEAGYNLVEGSFEAGGTVTTATDVLLHDAEGKAYSWGGILPNSVPEGSTPSSSGGIGTSAWVDQSRNLPKVVLQTSLSIPSQVGLSVGQRVEWCGYYAPSDGGSNWGIVKSGAHVHDGGKIFTITPTLYIEANLKGKSVNIRKFGAKGDGVFNDRLIVKSVVNFVNSSGGGDVVIPQGDFLISGFDGTYTVKELDGTIQYVDTPLDVQMYFPALSNIHFKFNGGRFVSDKTDGGATIAFDGFNNITITNPRMTGATVMSGSTATTVGTAAITLLSRSANSDGITITNPQIDKHYSSIDISGDPASAFKVANVTIDGVPRFTNGYYGLTCRGNGTNVRLKNGYSYRQNRPFFVYDTIDVEIQMIGDEMNGGFQSLLKAYTTNVININIDFSVRNRANIGNCIGIQSQHNPAVQPTPAYLRNIKIRYGEVNSAAGEAIRFDYYRDAVATASSSDLLFADITLEGKSAGSVTSGVSLTNNTNVCVLHMDEFNAGNGKAIYANSSGFVPSQVQDWTPADGSGAGLVMQNPVGKFVVGNTVSGVFSLAYPITANGSPAKLAGLPIRSLPLSANAQAVTVSYTDVGFPLYGLIDQGANTVSWYKNTGVAVTNAELSGKHLRGSFSYIV